MIKNGEKSEEYRDVTSHWASRLLLPGDYVYWKTYYKGQEDALLNYLKKHAGDSDCRWKPMMEQVIFQNGYAKNSPRMTFEIESISVGKGKEERGAEPNKEYFVIKLGKRLN